MERHAEANGCLFGRGKEQTVGAEIVEAYRGAPDAFEERAETPLAEQLARQDMVALKAGVEARTALAIDVSERDCRPARYAPLRLCRAPLQGLVSPDPDEAAIARGPQDQACSVGRDDPLALLEPAYQHELVDQPHAEPRCARPIG